MLLSDALLRGIRLRTLVDVDHAVFADLERVSAGRNPVFPTSRSVNLRVHVPTSSSGVLDAGAAVAAGFVTRPAPSSPPQPLISTSTANTATAPVMTRQGTTLDFLVITTHRVITRLCVESYIRPADRVKARNTLGWFADDLDSRLLRRPEHEPRITSRDSCAAAPRCRGGSAIEQRRDPHHLRWTQTAVGRPRITGCEHVRASRRSGPGRRRPYKRSAVRAVGEQLSTGAQGHAPLPTRPR